MTALALLTPTIADRPIATAPVKERRPSAYRTIADLAALGESAGEPRVAVETVDPEPLRAVTSWPAAAAILGVNLAMLWDAFQPVSG